MSKCSFPREDWLVEFRFVCPEGVALDVEFVGLLDEFGVGLGVSVALDELSGGDKLPEDVELGAIVVVGVELGVGLAVSEGVGVTVGEGVAVSVVVGAGELVGAGEEVTLGVELGAGLAVCAKICWGEKAKKGTNDWVIIAYRAIKDNIFLPSACLIC